MIGFKPKFWPTFLTIPGLILLFSLSYWQFNRLIWKENLIKEIKERSLLSTIDLPSEVNLSSMLYRKVRIKGEFFHEHEMHMYGGSRQFKGENGYYILTPLRLEDNRILIINRGWVPEKKKDSSKRPETLIKNLVEIEGTIMKSEEKPLYVHENQPERNLWFYIDLSQISTFLDKHVENYYILAKDNPNILPRGRDLEPNLRNHHLGYALTWLLSGIALAVIYVIYHKKQIENN